MMEDLHINGKVDDCCSSFCEEMGHEDLSRMYSLIVDFKDLDTVLKPLKCSIER